MKPRYISFDCYGTLIHFQMDAVLGEVFDGRLSQGIREQFLATCEAYRFDEVLGDYKPYRQVISDATRRAACRYGIEFKEDDADQLYEAVPSWGPHPGVADALITLGMRHKLVILSNAADEQIMDNVDQLRASFHAVFTAEQAKAYKPRLAAFEYMLRELGCRADEIAHVSSSATYDLRPARDVGIASTVLLDRGYEPRQPWLGYREIKSLPELMGALDG